MIEYANAAFIEFYDLKDLDITGKNCSETIKERGLSCLVAHIICPGERALKEGIPVMARDDEGATGSVIRAFPVKNDSGNVEKIVEIHHKDPLAGINYSEELLHSLLEGIGDSVVVISKDLKIIKANKRYLEMAGLTEEEVKGMNCYRVSHGYDSPCFEYGEDCPVIKTLRTGVYNRATHIHYSRDGQAHYVEISAYPLFVPGTDVLEYVIETVNDVTEQVRLKERLRFTEALYRELYDESPLMLFTINDDGKILECNRTMSECLGYGRKWLLDRNIMDILSPESRDRFIEKKRTCRIDEICNLEVSFVDSEGNSLPVELTGRKKLKTHQSIYNIVAKDLREIKKAEEEKRFLEAQLLQAQKLESIGTLSAGIAHDFNNILTGLIGYMELIEKHKDTQDIDKYIVKCNELLTVATNLTRQLLLVGRKAETEYQVIELNDFVRSFIATIKRILPENIKIECEFHTPELFIKGDTAQIYQMFLNLLLNARDAMPEGGTIFISLSSADRGIPQEYSHLSGKECAVVSIRDTGQGIEEGLLGRIFDPFFSTKEKSAHKGTGLGLSVVYSIVKCHGGIIDVKSIPQKGTEFIVYLPLTHERPTPVKRADEREGIREEITVLIVDDEEIICDVVKATLEDAGYRVFTALSGKEAIEFLRGATSRVDVAIIDRAMPEMDGIRTFRRLREIAPGLKCIASSGYSDENREELLRIGFVDFLRKPYKRDELLRVLTNVLKK